MLTKVEQEITLKNEEGKKKNWKKQRAMTQRPCPDEVDQRDWKGGSMNSKTNVPEHSNGEASESSSVEMNNAAMAPSRNNSDTRYTTLLLLLLLLFTWTLLLLLLLDEGVIVVVGCWWLVTRRWPSSSSALLAMGPRIRVQYVLDCGFMLLLLLPTWGG